MRLIKIYLIFRYFRFLFYMTYEYFGFGRFSGLPPSRSNEVLSIVSSHKNALWDLKQKADREVNKWADDLISEIKEHAQSQKDIVTYAYEQHNKRLNEIQKQHYDLVRRYEEQTKYDEVTQLIEKLKRIRIELVEKKSSSISKNFIEVEAIQSSKEMDIDTSTSTTNSNSSSATRSTTGGAESASKFADSGSINTTAHNRSTSNLIGSNTVNETCSICCMIFPPHMGDFEKTLHISEHQK